MRPSGSQIQPVILGDIARALCITGCLQSQGFDVHAIHPLVTTPISASCGPARRG